jgi:6-phospho-beta-glucosidase
MFGLRSAFHVFCASVQEETIMSDRRIVVVGGGSQFSVGLSESLIDYARDMLAGTTVVLLDIREEHLNTAHHYASQLAQAVGVDMKFEKMTDRRQAFEGADFLLTTFRPGSHREQEQDETIPPKYGLQGNETVSIGGIFMACRVVPVLQDICADAQDLCPDAWIINYTNPTQYVADVVRRISDMRIVSLCDGYVEVAEDLAPLLKVDPADITIYPAGTNHAIWVMHFTVRGEDGYPILRERLSQMSQTEINQLYAPPLEFDFLGIPVESDQAYDQFIPHHYYPFSLKLFRIYGLLPAPRYYWRYHLDQDAVIAEQRSGHYMTMAGFYIRHAVPRRFEGLDRRLERISRHLQTSRRKGGGSHGDLAVRVISAMVNDLGETFIVNVPNRGSISNLPQEAIVEVPAKVDRLGPHPFAMGPLPKSLLGYQYSLLLSQELAIDAALSGSRNDLLKAILAHPLVHSVDAAEKAMDELLALQAEWLPQFGQSYEV